MHMVFTMPTDRYPWAGDTIERFEYEVRSQVHVAAEQYPLTMFIYRGRDKQIEFYTFGHVDGQIGLVKLSFDEPLFRLMLEVLLQRRPAEDPTGALFAHYDHTVDEVQYRYLERFGELTGEEQDEEILRIAREMGASA